MAPLSMVFSRQEYCLGCCFLLQGIFLIQGLNPGLFHLTHRQVGSLPLATWEAHTQMKNKIFHNGELPVIGTLTWQCPIMVGVDEEAPGQED